MNVNTRTYMTHRRFIATHTPSCTGVAGADFFAIFAAGAASALFEGVLATVDALAVLLAVVVLATFGVATLRMLVDGLCEVDLKQHRAASGGLCLDRSRLQMLFFHILSE
jgi:hypothetical protein